MDILQAIWLGVLQGLTEFFADFQFGAPDFDALLVRLGDWRPRRRSWCSMSPCMWAR
jgi:hypothetical protein